MQNTIVEFGLDAIAHKASAKVTVQKHKMAAMNPEHPGRPDEERILAKLKHNASAANLNAGAAKS